MIKDLMLVVDNADKSAGFLRAGLSLAERLNAHAKVMLLTSGPLAAAEFAPFGALYVTEGALREDEMGRIERLRQLLDDARCSAEVCAFRDDIAWLPGDVRRSRQVTDLIVAGSIFCWDVPWLQRRVLDTLLLSSGTPLLLLPRDKSLEPVRHAVLGWKPSPEAARALHALIGIAEPGAVIDIVTVEGASERIPRRAEAAMEVEHYLLRHGMQPSVHIVHHEPWQTVAGELQRFAIERRADVLVVGGYAHARMREVWLGGVTRDLIGETQLPVLMAN